MSDDHVFKPRVGHGPLPGNKLLGIHVALLPGTISSSWTKQKAVSNETRAGTSWFRMKWKRTCYRSSPQHEGRGGCGQSRGRLIRRRDVHHHRTLINLFKGRGLPDGSILGSLFHGGFRALLGPLAGLIQCRAPGKRQKEKVLAPNSGKVPTRTGKIGNKTHRRDCFP